MKYLPFILFTVLTNAAAQIMLKQGMMSIAPVTVFGFTFADGLIGKLGQTLLNPWVFAGLCTFVISMGSHLFVLSRVELSFAYPFLSLAYVAVAVIAWMLWGENLNTARMAGIGLICLGTILIAQSGERQSAEPSLAAMADLPGIPSDKSELAR